MSLLTQAVNQAKIYRSGTFAEFSDLLLHTLFPNQFEYYMIGLALENSKGIETDRFIFPIKPSSLTNPDSIAANVIRTQGGVVSTYVNGFSPNIVQISGHFGRDFKLMVMDRKDYGEYMAKKTKGETWESARKFVSNTVVTGYGAFNKMRYIFGKSKELDPLGKPYKTVFYNMPYSQKFYVQLLNLDSNISTDKNLIHQYTLTMKKIGLASNKLIDGNKITSNGILAGINASVNTTKSILKQINL